MSVAKIVTIGMVVFGAMILGILVFLGFVLLSRERADFAVADSSRLPVISYAAAGFGLVALLALMVLLSKSDGLVRKMVAATQGKPVLEVVLARAMLVRGILIAAPLEAAALFNLVAYMLDGRAISIGATGVILLALASQFPTPDRASRWIERQKGRLEGGAESNR
jgi:hypothetical protein